MSIRVAQTARQQALSLMRTVQSHPSSCPCHVCTSSSGSSLASAFKTLTQNGNRYLNGAAAEKEYAFEMAASNIRYGPGVTKEVGMDFKNLGIDRVALFTDKNLINLDPVKTAVKALESQGIKYDIYSDVIIEPKDYGYVFFFLYLLYFNRLVLIQKTNLTKKIEFVMPLNGLAKFNLKLT